MSRIQRKFHTLRDEFKEKHPDCVKSANSKYHDQFTRLTIEAMGGKGDNEDEKAETIIKKILKDIKITKG
jgi:hypothetical protein